MKRDSRRGARRGGERGAALVTMMLLATLLLGAGAALLTASSIGASTAIDTTNEVQAYYAAEAGLQSALNVLRDNVTLVNGAAPARRPTLTNVVRNADGSPTARDLGEWLPYAQDNFGRTVVRVDRPEGGVQLWNRYASYRINVIPDDPDNPSALIVQSTGFGPRGSTKQIQMVVIRSTFNFNAPSTITLVGASNGNPLLGFAIGTSNAKDLSGVDQAGAAAAVPMFGFTQPGNKLVVDTTTFDCGTNQCDKARETVDDTPRTGEVTNAQLPNWLQSAPNAHSFLNELREAANMEERYFTTNNPPPSVGTAADPLFTFVDGDYSLGGSGGGLLVVTGNLTVTGNFSWNGLILVLGNGSMQRNGGGNGSINGAIVLASWDPDNPAGGFLAPSFTTNGGGNSTIQYNSVNVANSLTLLGFRVAGVREW